jgi:hypothetical protein
MNVSGRLLFKLTRTTTEKYDVRLTHSLGQTPMPGYCLPQMGLFSSMCQRDEAGGNLFIVGPRSKLVDLCMRHV